jgi:hypothetical protein
MRFRSLGTQGFTELACGQIRSFYYPGDDTAKLTVLQNASAGVIGGALACWNHPFEVRWEQDSFAMLLTPTSLLIVLSSSAFNIDLASPPARLFSQVARIQAQAQAANGEAVESMVGIFKSVVAKEGVGGLFAGIVPRMCLGIWQTLFMVTGAKVIRDALN